MDMKSIRAKIGLTLLVVTIASISGAVAAVSYGLIIGLRADKIEELRTTVAVAGDRNAAMLAFGVYDRAKENLEVFRGRPSVMAACLYDGQKKLVAWYARDEGARAPANCPEISDGNVQQKEGEMTVAEDIRVQGDVVGRLLVSADESEIDVMVKRVLLIALAVAGGMLVLFLPLIARLQNAIAKPIVDLTATAEHITHSGDYSARTPKRSDDEIGRLAEAFNAMIGETERRGNELAEANRSLEDKVKARTREAEAARRRAEAANDAKTEFLRNMSHEFRTPLHAMTSFAAYGEKEALEGDRSKLLRYFGTIQKATTRLTKLVEEVLNVAKLEHGQQTFHLRQVHVRDMIESVLDMSQSLLIDKNLTLVRNFPADDVTITCDADRIGQVLINIIGNAVKFSPRNSDISVNFTQAADEKISISICDHGVGIDESDLETIFEPFVQGKRTKDGSGGTGLGLAISRRIVEAHGGTITACNNTGEPGSTFTIVIPLEPTHMAANDIHQGAIAHG